MHNEEGKNFQSFSVNFMKILTERNTVSNIIILEKFLRKNYTKAVQITNYAYNEEYFI